MIFWSVFKLEMLSYFQVSNDYLVKYIHAGILYFVICTLVMKIL